MTEFDSRIDDLIRQLAELLPATGEPVEYMVSPEHVTADGSTVRLVPDVSEETGYYYFTYTGATRGAVTESACPWLDDPKPEAAGWVSRHGTVDLVNPATDRDATPRAVVEPAVRAALAALGPAWCDEADRVIARNTYNDMRDRLAGAVLELSGKVADTRLAGRQAAATSLPTPGQRAVAATMLDQGFTGTPEELTAAVTTASQ